MSKMLRIGGAIFGAAAACIIASACYAAEPAKAAEKSNAMTAYDLTFTEGDKQVRLVKSLVEGREEYSSFANGKLVAQTVVAGHGGLEPDASGAFNRYLNETAVALQAAGFDPKMVGLSYMTGTPEALVSGPKALATAFAEPANGGAGQQKDNATVTLGVSK